MSGGIDPTNPFFSPPHQGESFSLPDGTLAARVLRSPDDFDADGDDYDDQTDYATVAEFGAFFPGGRGEGVRRSLRFPAPLTTTLYLLRRLYRQRSEHEHNSLCHPDDWCRVGSAL